MRLRSLLPLVVPCALGAQASSPPPPQIVEIGSVREEMWRDAQLSGNPQLTAGFLLRSLSSQSDSLIGTGSLRGELAPPRLLYRYNSAVPYSLNEGELWAGRGGNTSLLMGGQVAWRNLHLWLLPELVHSPNLSFPGPDSTISPSPPSWRSPFSSPWNADAQSIDLPIRFGAKPITQLTPGQSSAIATFGAVDVGFSTENQWWGPGIRNALIMSNNAPGFPYLFVRSAHPLVTPIGTFEWRWLSGGLTQSAYFDSTSGLRSLAALGVTWQPANMDGVTFGAARSVFAPSHSWGNSLSSFLQVFRDVGHPDAVPPSDTTPTNGPDQLMSLFARGVWRGFEAYVEWARTELPVNLNDFLTEPNNTQGYTLGFQWMAGEPLWFGAKLRAQAEATYLEQSTTFRFRDIGSWYTSHAVPQGYTEDGRVLGAAIGPGSASQWIAVDGEADRWGVGTYLTRIQWLEDDHSQQTYYNGTGWCEHDVSLLPGIRAHAVTRWGTVSGDFSSGWRINLFFRHYGYCPDNTGFDVRNNSLAITFSPSVLRW